MLFTRSNVLAQEDPGVEKQLWTMAFFNFRLDNKWVYSQDAAYQHSYETPTFTRILLRSQTSCQISGFVSLHGGLNFLYKFNELENNAIELRPWVGTKLRWPNFWRLNFVHYLRFEQRFEHSIDIDDWDNNFRVRYKVGSNLPINHRSLIDRTFFGLFGYEFFSSSFEADIRFTTADFHRVDVGFGYRQNVKNRYEAMVVALNGRDEGSGKYELSSVVLYLRYRRFINWE